MATQNGEKQADSVNEALTGQVSKGGINEAEVAGTQTKSMGTKQDSIVVSGSNPEEEKPHLHNQTSADKKEKEEDRGDGNEKEVGAVEND